MKRKMMSFNGETGLPAWTISDPLHGDPATYCPRPNLVRLRSFPAAPVCWQKIDNGQGFDIALRRSFVELELTAVLHSQAFGLSFSGVSQ